MEIQDSFKPVRVQDDVVQSANGNKTVQQRELTLFTPQITAPFFFNTFCSYMSTDPPLLCPAVAHHADLFYCPSHWEVHLHHPHQKGV